MADSNKVVVSYYAEDTWGTAKSGVAYSTLPITGGSMSESPSTTRSSQIRTDQQMASSKRTGTDPTAQFDVELQGDNLDEFLRVAARNSSDFSTATANISPTATGHAQITASAKTLVADATNAFQHVTKGQWVQLSGYTSSANNDWFQVSTITNSNKTLTFTAESAANVANADPTSGTVKIGSRHVSNGTADPSYTFQANYSDESSSFRRMVGCKMNSFGINVSQGSIITGSMGFNGKQLSRETGQAGSSVATITSNDVMADVDGFGGLWIDGTKKTGYDVTGVSLNMNSATRGTRVLGSSANQAVHTGALEVTGSLELYLDATSYSEMQDRMLAYTPFSLGFEIHDDNTDDPHGLFFFMPKVYLTGDSGQLGGMDSDVLMSFDFAAEPGALGDLTKTIQITKSY